jgi:Protein of unknown function (DUF1579)
MKLTAVAFLSFVVLVTPAFASGFGAAGVGQLPPTPKPGAEHELLKMDVGTWDATVEVMTAPGNPAMTSKGVETNTLGCGGLCLITDFKGDLMPGVPFQGHGVATWDPRKNKYVVTWTDSMSSGLSTGESTWDPAAKRMTGWMEGADMTGQVTKTKSVVEYAGGNRVMTAYVPGPDGKEFQMLKITYTKRK